MGIIALVVALACLWLWFRAIEQVDLPKDRTAYVVVFLTAAALGVGAFVKGPGWIGGMAAAPAIIIGLFFPFSVAISRQEVATNAIQVGATIPHFTAVDEHGELFDSESLHGHLVFIKFFRGYW